MVHGLGDLLVLLIIRFVGVLPVSQFLVAGHEGSERRKEAGQGRMGKSGRVGVFGKKGLTQGRRDAKVKNENLRLCAVA
jgi:hypothetical protein